MFAKIEKQDDLTGEEKKNQREILKDMINVYNSNRPIATCQSMGDIPSREHRLPQSSTQPDLTTGSEALLSSPVAPDRSQNSNRAAEGYELSSERIHIGKLEPDVTPLSSPSSPRKRDKIKNVVKNIFK